MTEQDQVFAKCAWRGSVWGWPCPPNQVSSLATAREGTGPTCCSYRGHTRHLFGDMTDTFGIGQVDGSNPVACEEDAVLSVGASGADCDAFSAESLGHFP